MLNQQHQEKLCEQVRSFLERQNLSFNESEEQYARRFDVRHGKYICAIKVFSSSKIQIQGAETQLKKLLNQMKDGIETDETPLGTPLPFEIQSFPGRLREIGADSIIVGYIEEAIVCLKHEALLGGAFLLGAASEKAIWNLIGVYTRAITNEANRANFEGRTNKRFISVAYDEFKKSFGSAQSKPTDPVLANELLQQIDDLFNFYRRCRNKIGHPDIPPNLNKGAILANMGQFITYVEVIRKLEEYFQQNPVIL